MMTTRLAPSRQEVLRAVAALVFITFLWGASFPLVKSSNRVIEQNNYPALDPDRPLTMDDVLPIAAASMAVRFLLSLVVLLGLFPRQFLTLTLKQWLMGIITGCLLATGLVLQTAGLSLILASRSGFLTSLSVVFTPLFMVAVTGRKPSWKVILAVIVALVGAAILNEPVRYDEADGWVWTEGFTAKVGLGDLLTILAAAIFTVQIILIDRFSQRMPPALLTPGMFAATVVIGGAVFAIHHLTSSSAVPLWVWAGLFEKIEFPLITVVICVFCTIVPFHYMNKYQAMVTPTQAALIYSMEPLFAVLWALFLPKYLSGWLNIKYESETLNLALVVGGSLVIAANLLGFESQASEREEQSDPIQPVK